MTERLLWLLAVLVLAGCASDPMTSTPNEFDYARQSVRYVESHEVAVRSWMPFHAAECTPPTSDRVGVLYWCSARGPRQARWTFRMVVSGPDDFTLLSVTRADPPVGMRHKATPDRGPR